MSFNLGNMLSLTLCNSKSVMVGNGVILLITHIGKKNPHSHNRLALNDALVSNKMVNNLVLMCKFTVENSIILTFDPFGFTLKDFKIGFFIQRCDSVSDLYPIVLYSLFLFGIEFLDIPVLGLSSFYY